MNIRERDYTRALSFAADGEECSRYREQHPRPPRRTNWRNSIASLLLVGACASAAQANWLDDFLRWLDSPPVPAIRPVIKGVRVVAAASDYQP